MCQVAFSEEMKALAKKAVMTDPMGRLPRAVIERSPGLRRRLKRLLGKDRPTVYYRPGSAKPGSPLEIHPHGALVLTDKARRVLGYGPAVSRDQALELTLEWARYARTVK